MKSRKHTKPPVVAGLALLALVTASWLSSTRPDTPPATTAATHLTPALPKPARAETLAGFADWLETYSTASASERTALATEGLALARERRVVMQSLIKSDPQRALETAVSLDVWQSLPAELRAEVEEPFSALVSYQVLPVCGSSPSGEKLPDAVRSTTIDGQPRLDTHVFGKRLGITSKEQAPVQGIRLGGLAALHEGTFRKLPDAEIPSAKATYPLANPHADRDFANGEALGDAPVTALAGGKVFLFADDTSFENFSTAVDALDNSPAPQGGSSLVFQPYPADGSGGFNLEEVTILNNNFADSWTETKKKVFIIRCDFSDKTNAAFPAPAATTYETLLNTTISDNIENYSYGKTWIEATVSPTVLRLNQTAAYYAQLTSGSSRNDELLEDAIAKYDLETPSFNAGDYNIVGVWFTSIGMQSGNLTYAGLAGGSALWIQGNTDAEVHVHEFGHNYGIGHSSFWKPSVGSTNPLDPSGTFEEYGDPFDVMGGGPIPDGVFHSQAKQRLNWLGTGEWTDATAAGSATHRLYRIDDAATAGVRGVRVTKGADEYLWLSYRRLFSNNSLRAGANVVWERPGQSRAWLIDTTPGSQPGSADRTDGALAIGRTLSTGNSHITPLARGGSGSGEWLDVRVNTGPFAGNVAPVATLNGPSNVPARQTVVFTAQATDSNGDELAYSWDFGQGFAFDNNPTATYSWAVGGTFTVKVTVSDMKGNTTQATKVVTVSDAITTWNTRANSSGGTFHAMAASASKVIAAGDDFSSFRGPVATSADGSTWTATQLPLNQHAYAATWDGTQFLLAGLDYNGSSAVGAVFRSPTANAGTWTTHGLGSPILRGIAYGNGVHVAVGDSGIIRRSIDGGAIWSTVVSGTTNRLNSVSYGGGKFVAVGYTYTDSPPAYNGNVTVLTSTDGQTWTNTSSGAGLETWQDFRSVKWAHDRFLASGFYSKLRYSVDVGVSFGSTRTSDEYTPGIAYGNGIWFAAGTEYDDVGGTLGDVDLVSADGINWTNLTTPALDNRNAAVFFNNTFITAGENHSIRQSATISQGASGFYTWRESNFPDHGPQSTPDGDGDGDGSENLIEYALGRSPLSGGGSDGPSSLPQAVVGASEPTLSDRLALQVDLPASSPGDVVHVVEASSTLQGSWSALATKTGNGSWVWNAGGTSRIVTSAPSGGRVVVKVGDSVATSAEPARFLRLRAYVNQ